LIGDGTGMTGITNGTNGNQVGTAVSPLLNALNNNGGPLRPCPSRPAVLPSGAGGRVTIANAAVSTASAGTLSVANGYVLAPPR